VLIAAAVGLILALTGGGKGKLKPAAGNGGGTYDPLAYDKDRRAEFEQDAATGEGHVVFAKSPGGVIATARRTAHFRPLIDRAAKAGGIDPNMLEAVVFLESAGRPDVVAGNDLSGATGLTQILAETGTKLLGMHVNLAASKRLTRRIDNARSAKGRQRLERSRMRVDQRFDPARSLAATVRYLTIARKQFGQDDFAFTSYHMGIGNLQSVLRDYGGGKDLTYAQVYFDSSPLNHPKAYALLSRFGDDSSNYYWKLLAARDIMHGLTTARSGRAALLTGAPQGDRRQLSGTPGDTGLTADSALSLRPEALATALYMAAQVREISGAPSLRLVGAEDGGWTFRVSRRYTSPQQALAFQYVLDRLQVLNVIAWSRTANTIRVTAGRDAEALEPLLDRLGGKTP